MSRDAQRRERRWAERVLGLILDNPGDAIYGSIAVGAVLAAESPRQETYADTMAAVAITLVVYWLAHAYADLTGQRVRSGARLTTGRLLATMLHESPILLGAAVPLVALAICWIAGAALATAVLAALWTSAGILVATEVATGLRGHLKGRQLLAQTLMGALLGGLILLLKVVLH